MNLPALIRLATLAATCTAVSLQAQSTSSAAAPAGAPGGKAVELAKFEVTDTRADGLYNKPVFRTDEEAPLAFNVIDRIEIERMGVTNLDEIVRNIPEATNYGSILQRETSENATTGGTTYSSSNINLRNLGTGNTVLLINGRRLTSGASSDISRIPPSAIDRIEILPAAAAAIYGGNALGGAINIILRKDVSGTDLTFNYGGSTRGGAREYSGSIRHSRPFNQGRSNLTLLLSYSHRDKFTQGQTPILERAYARYGPTSTVRMPSGGLAFESFVLNANTLFVGNPGYIKADVATGTPGTPLLSGDSSTRPLGIPGAPTAWYAQLPAGLTNQQALALTPASFTATAGKFNESREWRGNRTVLYVPSTLYGLTATFDHTLKPEKLFAYAEIILALKRDNYSFPTSLGFPYGLALSATDALNPFRTGVTPGFVGVPVRVYYDPIDIPDSSTLQERNGASVTLGLKGVINRRWNWTFDTNGDYARQGSDAYVPVNYLQTFLTRPGLTDATTGTRAPTSLAERRAIYNPLADHRANPLAKADVDRLFQFNRAVVNYQRSAQVNPRIAGRVYDLPAGALTTQLRGEVRWEQSNSSQFFPFSPDMSTMVGIAPSTAATSVTRASTTTKAIGMELVAPVIGRSFRPVPVYSAEVQGTARRNWTNRGRGGDVTSLAGQVWLTSGLSLRASLSEGLVPLTVTQIQAPTITPDAQQTLVDPLRGNISRTVTIRELVTGGNPNLRNEFSRTRSVGFILRPGWLQERVSLTATYADTKRFDAVGAATAANILSFPDDFPGRVVRAPLTAADQAAGYTGGEITRLDLTQINLAKTYIETIDLRSTVALTRRENPLGQFQLISNATFTNRFITQARPNAPRINNIRTVNGTTVLGPLRWKGSAQLWWYRDPWNAGFTARYTDMYFTDTTRPTPGIPTANRLDGDHIPSALYYDLQVSYSIPYADRSSGWRRLVAGTKWTLNIRNLLDDDPPFRSEATGGFYSRFDDPRGRFVSLEVKKSL